MLVFKPNQELFDDIAEYSYPPHYFTVDDVNMHYVDVGEGPVILMVHGMPTWGYLYRDFIKKFTDAGYRCIVPDHIGFGRSDKVGNLAYYSTAKHCENLARLIQHLNLQNITLICQDWGGPIGLNQAVNMPERFDRLVIMNTWLAHDNFEYTPAIRNWNKNWQTGGLFHTAPQLCTVVPLLSAGLYDSNHLGAVARGAISINETIPQAHKNEWKAWCTPFIPPGENTLPDVNSDSSDIYSGACMFPLSLPFYDPTASNQAIQNKNFNSLLKWDGPIDFIWGCQDEVFPQQWGRQWASLQKNSSFLPIEDAGHFLQNTHGHFIADTVLQKLSSKV